MTNLELIKLRKKFAKKHTKIATHYTFCDNCDLILINMGGTPDHITGHTFYHMVIQDNKVVGWAAHCEL